MGGPSLQTIVHGITCGGESQILGAPMCVKIVVSSQLSATRVSLPALPTAYLYIGPKLAQARKSAPIGSLAPNSVHTLGRKMVSSGTLCI